MWVKTMIFIILHPYVYVGEDINDYCVYPCVHVDECYISMCVRFDHVGGDLNYSTSMC